MKNDRLVEPIPITQHTWNNQSVPTVSVFSWVYNHKDFIRESIESILIQKTNFPVEVIIHDDASNDGTAEIIREYEAKYPNLFRNILQNENQWSQGKSVMTPLFEKPRGKYIALTHGDDYWTDPLKLQKQVDFLEGNQVFAGCFHDAQFVEANGKVIRNQYHTPTRNSYTQRHCLTELRSGYATCTLMFTRLIMKNGIPKYFNEAGCDELLDLWITEYGELGYLPMNMAVYRKHSGGIWQGNTSLANNEVLLKRYMSLKKDEIIYRKYPSEIDERIVQFSKFLSKYGTFKNRFKYLLMFLHNSKMSTLSDFKFSLHLIKLFVKDLLSYYLSASQKYGSKK